MKTQINGTKSDISAMLLSAERYALGRQTYIVDWTCEFISNNLHLILERDKKVMIRDIKEQEAELCAAFVIANYGYNLQSHLNYVYSWNLTKVNASQVMDQIAEVATFIENGLNKYLNKEQK